MRIAFRALVLAGFSASALIGCLPTDGPQDGGTSSSSGTVALPDGGDSGATNGAGKACLDEASAYATAAQRCGGDYAMERIAFINDVAGGDCNSVTIRNVTELETMCLATFSTISCDDLTNARFDPSCAEQIQRTK